MPRGGSKLKASASKSSNVEVKVPGKRKWCDMTGAEVLKDVKDARESYDTRKKQRSEESQSVLKEAVTSLQNVITMLGGTDGDEKESVITGLLERLSARTVILRETKQELARARSCIEELEHRLKLYEKRVRDQNITACFFASKSGVIKAHQPRQIIGRYKELTSLLKTPFSIDGKLVAKVTIAPEDAPDLVADYGRILSRAVSGRSESDTEGSVMMHAALCPPNAIVRVCLQTCLREFVFESTDLIDEVGDDPILQLYRGVLLDRRTNDIDGWINLRNLDLITYQQYFDTIGFIEQELQNHCIDLVEKVAKAIMPLFRQVCYNKTKWELFLKDLQSMQLDKPLDEIIRAAWDFYKSKLLSPDWYGFRTVPAGTPFDPTWMTAEDVSGESLHDVERGRTVKLCLMPALLWASAAERFTDEQTATRSTALVKNNTFLPNQHQPPSGKSVEVYVHAIVLVEEAVQVGKPDILTSADIEAPKEHDHTEPEHHNALLEESAQDVKQDSLIIADTEAPKVLDHIEVKQNKLSKKRDGDEYQPSSDDLSS